MSGSQNHRPPSFYQPLRRPPHPKRSSLLAVNQYTPQQAGYERVHHHSNSNSRADAADANFTSQLTKHQRARPASAVVYRSKYDDNFLKPVPSLPSCNRYMMASVMIPAAVPESFGVKNPATRQFIERSSSYTAADAVGAIHPYTKRSSSMPMGAHESYSRPTSSSSNASSIMSKDSFETAPRSPASSVTSLGTWDSSPRRAEFGWQRPVPVQQQYRRKAAVGELFAALPGEVLELILDELKKLHLAPNSASCATCMMRDLCAVALSSRKWLKFARVALYEDIQLVGNDSHLQKKRYKINHGSRLALLRRTLRANSQIAAIVHNLKAPMVPQGVALDSYRSLVASVVMSCPNFERLKGPQQIYDHNWNRLLYAVSTREKLKEMNWVVDASPFQRQRRLRSPSSNDLMSQIAQAPGDLQPQQSAAFLELNMNWTHLTTLSIHCLPGATLTPLSLIGAVLDYMPALQNLHLSNLPATSFNDTNLISLPPLNRLSLSYLPGITSAGLSSFATCSSSRSITNLKLRHVNLDSLPALARILLNLGSLETFSLAQSTTPILPEGEMIWLFPYLASPSLRKLHWDITSHPTCANMADSILTKSIAAHGFPSLRVLRAPNDPEGTFQALCSPVEKIEMASDKYRSRGMGSKTTDGQPGTPNTPNTPSDGRRSLELAEHRESSNLHQSRRAAQNRLEAARRFPRYFVNVVDEDGSVTEKYGIAGFLGSVESKINYCLTPDAGATDEHGGLVDISDMLGDGGEDLVDREGCTGRWNPYNGNTTDKKDRDRWAHTERGRWRGVSLF